MQSGKTDKILRGAICVLVLALIAVTATTLEQRIVVAGDAAPGFEIVADNGKKISLTSFGGRLLVLNFWATWCPPCIQELPSLNAFQDALRGNGVVVLAVSLDKNEKTYKAFLDRAQVGFLTARDPEANISSSYGTFKYPETYVINARGEVLEKFVGPENWLDPKLIERIRKHL
ncbi:MAG: TlpA family protein disulfide reductase [Candidatus Solibacter usitatus]|nr:TlpA family protein disulfide reductase [Candidatus Solibacter usitatus]